MKKSVIIPILFLFANVLFCQNSIYDSLDVKLSKMSDNLDSFKEVEDYFQKCLVIQKAGNFEKSLNYYHKLKEIAERKNNKQVLMMCYLRIAMVLHKTSKYKDALEMNNKAIMIYENSKDDKGIQLLYADVSINIGTIFDDIADYQKAIEYYHKSIIASKSINDTTRILKATMNIGACFYNLRVC